MSAALDTAGTAEQDTTTTTLTSRSVTISASLVAGETAYLVLVVGASTAAVTISSGPGAGWSLDVGPASGGFTTSQIVVWRKVLVAGDLGATVTVTISAARQMILAVVAASGGAHQGYSSVTTNSLDTTPSFAAVTPAANNALIIAIEAGAAQNQDIDSTRTPPASYTEQVDNHTTRTTANRIGLGIHSRVLSGGSGTPTTPGDETIALSPNTGSYNSNTVVICYTPTGALTSSTSDAAGGTDAVTRTGSQPRSTTDTGAGTDTVAAAGARPRATSDSAAATDSVTAAVVRLIARSTSDTAGGTDTAARTLTAARSPADAAGGTDAVARVLHLGRGLSDAAGGSDAVTRVVHLTRSGSDAAGGVAAVIAVLYLSGTGPITRTWPAPATTRMAPFPDLRNGTTIHHISDTHFGAIDHADFVNNWQDRTADDLDFLQIANNAGHVMTGDMIQLGPSLTSPGNRTTELGWYKDWRAAIQAADGLPWAECNGNHDMRTADGEHVLSYTAADWAADIGVASQNMVHDMGEVRIITIGPDVWDIDNPANPDPDVNLFRLSQPTLDFLDAQLQAAGKPCFIACHIVLQEQFTSQTEDGYNAANVENPQLNEILIANPNAVGWLSGHKHVNIQTKVDHATVMTLTGSTKKMYAINAPGAAGGTLAGVADADHQWESVNQSMYLTYLGDALDVRWRNHNTRTWTGPGAETVRHLVLS